MSSGVDEFDIIRTYFAPLEGPDPRSRGIVTAIGDDAAVLELEPGRQLVVSVDTLVSGVHFPPDLDPTDIGWRSLAVNASDLAAMGADPHWFTLALTLPENDAAWLAAFAAGLADSARYHDLCLVGGDTTRGPLTISIQVGGSVASGEALTRSGARVGDLVFVSGTLGDAAGGLQLLQGATSTDFTAEHEELVARFRRPRGRTELGAVLRGIATAAIDVSDGLLADLGHIARQSGVGAQIGVAGVPLSAALRASFPADVALELAVCGGDDYELCFTVPEAQASAAVARAAGVNCPVTCIGRIESAPGVRCMDEAGRVVGYARQGYRHFGEPGL